MTRIEYLCRTHVSHKWLHHLDACAGSVLTPHDFITNVQKRLSTRVEVGVSLFRFLPRPTLTCRNLQHSRGHERTLRERSRCGVRFETRRPGRYYGTQRAHCFAVQGG